MHVLLWTGIVTVFLKDFFALPRPSDVDVNVKLINKDYLNSTAFDSMGAQSFFGALPPEVVDHFRSVDGTSFGLPSGHVSITTALWSSVFGLFRPAWVKALSVALIVLIPITRMYLGRPFLEFLRAAIVGLVVLISTTKISIKLGFYQRPKR